MEPTIYLFFKGNCLEAMTHYAKTLGGEICGIFRNADAPSEACRMPGGDDLVMHMAIRLGAAMVMGSDAPADHYAKPQGFSVSVAPASLAEFDRIFATLAKEAESVMMPPAETFWAERFAMFTDRYGTPWMLNFAGAKDPASKGASHG
jgi:PhnB protein